MKEDKIITISEMQEKMIEYLEWMRIKNYSEDTVESRKNLLKYFRRWCAEREITRPQEVTRPILEAYQRYLYHYRNQDNKRLNTQTQQIRLTALRSFFAWLSKYRHIIFNPASELELPRSEQRLPQATLSLEEVELVMQQINLNNPMGYRDRAILETLYSTGMRRKELCGLKKYDIDLDREEVMIRQGKFKKDRVVPIGSRALAWVEKYLSDIRPCIPVTINDDVLFLTQKGKSLRPKHLSRIAHKYVTAAGINKEGSCHIFRHTMATLMLENGADTRYIQQILGHVNLSTTQIYTRVSIGKLKEVHSQAHPGAKLERKSHQ